MPLFDVVCEGCGNEAEAMLKENECVDCPVCGTTMTKLFPNTFNFRLKYDPKVDRITWSSEGYAETQRYREYDKQAKHNIHVMPGNNI